MKLSWTAVTLLMVIMCQWVNGLSTSKTLVEHPQFRSGRKSIPATSVTGQSGQTITVVYSSALVSSNQLQQPIIGIVSVDFTPQLFNVGFLTKFGSYDSNGFQFYLIMDRSKIIQFTFSYLSCQVPAGNNYYYIIYFELSGPYKGATTVSQPYNTQNSYPSTTKPIIFVYSLNITSTSANTFQLDQVAYYSQPNQMKITYNIKSDFTIQHVFNSFILIDQAAFQADLPAGSSVQAGTFSTTINTVSDKMFTSIFEDSLIIGLNKFWYSGGKMVIKSILNSTEFFMQSQNFIPIQFSYLQVKYYGCPKSTPFFNSIDSLCYDDCGAKYFEQPATSTCQQCMYQCGDCLDKSSCSSCNALDNRQLNVKGDDCIPKVGFFQNGTEVAPPCQSPCLTCEIDNSTCLSCIDASYFFDSANNICIPCATIFANCLQCSTTQCTLCDNGFVLNSATLICEVASIPCATNFANCLQCSSTQCTLCNTGFVLNSTTLMCEVSVISISCSSIQISNGCVQCPVTDPNACSSCNQVLGYYLSSSVCTNMCGDSILNTNLQQCEDGNTDDMDGCSSSCIIQSGFNCVISSVTTLSQCTYVLPINFTINSLYKIPQDNKVKASMTLSPPLRIFQNYNFQALVTTDLPVSQYIFNYDKLTGILQMVMRYDETIEGRQFQVTIDPPNLGVFLATPPSHLVVTMTSTDLTPVNFYEQTYYGLASAIFYMSIAISVLAWVIVFFGCYFGKIIGIQTLGVLQLTFVSMLSFPHALNPCLKSLAGLSFSNGLNIFMISKQSVPSLHPQQYSVSILPINYRQLLWNVTFLENYNVNILSFLVPLIIALSLFIAIKIKERKECIASQIQEHEQKLKSLGEYCYKFLFQITLVGLILTLYVFSCSMGIQLRYGLSNMQIPIDYASIVFLIIVLVPYITYFVLLLRDTKMFGEFKTFFSKAVNHSQKLYYYVIIDRFLIGLIVSAVGSPFALIIPIGSTILQFVIIIIKKPYSTNLNNYRTLANLSIQFLILVTLLGLSTVQFIHPQQTITNSPMQTSPIFFYAPLLIIILLLALIVYNFIFMIIYARSSKEQAQDKQIMQKQIIDLNKLRMQAYEMNQFMPSPFILLREQLDRNKKIHKNIKIAVQQQQTILGQISPCSNVKGPLLNKDYINLMFQQKIQANKQEEFKFDTQTITNMRKLKDSLANPMDDAQLAQQWQQIDKCSVKDQHSPDKMLQQQIDQKKQKSNNIVDDKNQIAKKQEFLGKVSLMDYDNL